MYPKFLQRQTNFCVLAKTFPTKNGKCFAIVSSSAHKLLTCAADSIMGKVLVNGVHLHWEKFGNGPHAVLCLPGFVGSVWLNFVPVIQKMNLEKFTMIGVDPAGYGKSRPPDRNVFTQEFCLAKDGRLAGMVMKELGYDKFSVLGWSNGGVSAAYIASASPATVQKLVLVNAPFGYNARTALLFSMMAKLSNWKESQLSAMLEVYERPYLEKLLQDWKKFVEDTHNSPELKNYGLNTLHKISAPTLYIRGMKDIIVLLEEGEEYMKNIRNFKFHKVTNGAHDQTEFVDELVAVTEKFLSSQ